jgi:hypothetical protein
MIIKMMLAAVLSVLTAAPAFAQTTQTVQQSPSNAFDSRWNPYLGCWRIVQEHQGVQTVPIAPGLMVCAQPSGRTGVSVTTTVDGKNVLEQTIIADGSAQPVTQADCRGTQTSDWSRDGERLFTRAEIECAGRPKRVVSGITQLSRGFWIDAQATVIDGDHDVRLRRYQRTSDQYGSAATPTGAPMSVEDVIEANAKVLGPALEAALVEAGGRFSLNSRTLKQLADAGVSPSVIDVMVAQAFPDRFEIERPSTYPSAPVVYGASGGAGMATNSWGGAYGSPMYDPFYSSYYYYSPFAYPYYWGAGYYPYRYSYGYRNYYNNNYYYGYPRGSVYGPYSPGGDEGGSARPGSPDSPGGDGIVVNGRGYTRVRPAGSGQTGGESAQPTSRTTTSGSGARAGRSRGSSSSGTESSGGSSSSSSDSSGGSSGSSSSGDSGGRTAQPR